ncbi:hypothetical protein BDV96DRAFT_496710 [Lophiotrema nucula]|uniref:PWI domain-containing protein n=1 Tax=Lophiotrema nucula TaxID=690887 RepID=A0A6A5Z3F6_9PLEO|nr:hypothetical protein BDV96DRAFT_496710 [Lophiotrema nucula]
MSSPAPGYAGPPPILAQNGPPQFGAPRSLPSGWQPPTNLPNNINFNAPVIRLGTGPQRGAAMDGPGGRGERGGPGRAGVGMDRNTRDADGGRGREPVQLLIPPTREEIARTIFVANITDGVGGDEGMERILATAGNLRRWTRATDANNRPQTFGFAEFEDSQSLETAAEIFKDIYVPTKRIEPSVKQEEGEEAEVEKSKLMVVVDEESIKYAETWKASRNEDEITVQFRLDNAKESLASVLAGLFNPRPAPKVDYSGDTIMQDVKHHDGNGADVPYIPLSAAEDELAEIPAEMREVVAAEIASFRDRSNKRDMERLRREEELEAAERRRSGRRTSLPNSAPTGPSGAGVNGVPLGPKADRGVQGAPSGPKGGQFPRDYQGGVSFVNGGTFSNGSYIKREDDDDSASDEELERRRKSKEHEKKDQAYRRKWEDWRRYEIRNTSSLQRQRERQEQDEYSAKYRRDEQAEWLKNFDDDQEAAKRQLLFYRDPGSYMRDRERIRIQEDKSDAIDRELENGELAVKHHQREVARGLADNFLDQTAEEIFNSQARPEPAKFKMSLGAAAKKVGEVSSTRRSAAEVENMLDDEEVSLEPAQKRTLKPINFEGAAVANLSEEDVGDLTTDIARSIPNTKEGLWDWPVAWEHLSDKHIEDLRDWAEKKILQTLGVQDDSVVDAIIDHLRSKGKPQDLVDNLADLLDEEAETIVKKLWRVVIYYTECDKRGLK